MSRSGHLRSPLLPGRAVGLSRARPPRASRSRPAARSSSLFTPLTASLVVLSGPLHARAGVLELGLGAQAAPTTSTCTGTPLPEAPDDLSAHRAAQAVGLARIRHGCADAPVHPFVGAREHTLRRGAPPAAHYVGGGDDNLFRRLTACAAAAKARTRRPMSPLPAPPPPTHVALRASQVPSRASRRWTAARPRRPTSAASAPTPSPPPSSSPRRAPPPAVRAADASLHFTSLHFTSLREPSRGGARLAAPARGGGPAAG